MPHLPFKLSPNNDQHQISPCNINAYLTPKVMRIKDMITQGDFSGRFNNFSPVLFQEKVTGQDKRICSLVLGVKGLRADNYCLSFS